MIFPAYIGALLLIPISPISAYPTVSGSSHSSSPTANLGYVTYIGSQNATTGINYFRGIPYAQPPTGSLRWQKPQPIELKNNFNGKAIHAANIAPACFQSLPLSLYTPIFVENVEATPQGQSEDCLVLDILAPINPVSSTLPVMIQIHGGGFTAGSAESYPGDAMVNASNGKLIYVSIQYRLGLFGFLAGSEVAKQGALNGGLLDQREAIDWVLRNIHAFGGNPSRVTIWGGSAGGSSVMYQLIANGGVGNPGFVGAIAEYPWWQPMLNASSQEIQYQKTLDLAHCSDLSCLRSLPGSALATLNQAVQNASYPAPGNGFGDFYWGPVVDKTFIMDLPDQEFKKGNFYKVALLVDHDAYEGVAFSNSSQTSQVAEVVDAENLFPFAGPTFFSRLYELYPRSAYNSTFFQRQSWFGDFIINCPTYQMASSMLDLSPDSSAVWKLTFAAGSQLHGATAPFLFSETPNSYPYANNMTLAKIMTSYWISFGVTLNPNKLKTPEAPFWPSYIAGGEGTVSNGESVGFSTLGITYSSIEVKPDPDKSEKCEFFGNRGWTVRN